MEYKIKILRTIENSVFGQYEAELISDISKEVVGTSEVVDKIPKLNLIKGCLLTIDASSVNNQKIVISMYSKEEILVTGLISIVAQNSEKGCLLTVSKILN